MSTVGLLLVVAGSFALIYSALSFSGGLMTAMIRTVRLKHVIGKQAIDLPKRARPLHIYLDDGSIAMDVVQDEDADTRAFDVKNQRYFEVVTRGAPAPVGAHIGSVVLAGDRGAKFHTVAAHVYEVQAR
jgi:hypothetical protein